MMFADQKRRSLHWAEAFGASAVVHLGAAILAFDLLDGMIFRSVEEQPEPEVVISSIILDADVIPVSQAPVTNDPVTEEPTNTEPPIAEPVADPVAAAEPEAPVEPEAETPIAEPEIPQDLVPQTLAPITPQQALSPQPVSPLRPQDGQAIAMAPRAVGTASTVAPVTLAPATVQTIKPLQTLPTPRPPIAASQQAPTPEGSAAAGAVSELIARIRGRLADTCLLALPQEGAGGTPELVMLAADEIGMQAFANAVLEGLDPTPGLRSILMDGRQCAALNFVRENASYPAFRLSVSLDQSIVESGSNLTGSIGNVAGRYVSLLLIDDNGVVQDMGSYLSFTGSAARFDAPLTRDGGTRDTSQILLALATNTRPATLNAQNGQLADAFFAALRAELGPNTPIVLAPFDVR